VLHHVSIKSPDSIDSFNLVDSLWKTLFDTSCILLGDWIVFRVLILLFTFLRVVFLFILLAVLFLFRILAV